MEDAAAAFRSALNAATKPQLVDAIITLAGAQPALEEQIRKLLPEKKKPAPKAAGAPRE